MRCLAVQTLKRRVSGYSSILQMLFGRLWTMNQRDKWKGPIKIKAPGAMPTHYYKGSYSKA